MRVNQPKKPREIDTTKPENSKRQQEKSWYIYRVMAKSKENKFSAYCVILGARK